MKAYLDIVEKVLTTGTKKKDRTNYNKTTNVDDFNSAYMFTYP